MFGLGIGEILIILVIAFLLFGPKQLPEVARQVGKAVKGSRKQRMIFGSRWSRSST